MTRIAASRRQFLQASAMAIAGVGAHESLALGTQGGGMANAQFTSIKALVFDTFGTVVDWRTSVTREVEALAKRKGELPWTKLDALHRMTLDKILVDFGITGLTEAETDHLNRAWHRLQPWPDAVAGLTRLRKRFTIAPLSNGNISLMTAMAKHSGLPWDVILGAELARHYKPDREVYQSAADFLDLAPAEVMMVAAHSGDLRAAAQVGLRTAFVTRLLEYGPNGKPDLKAATPVDISATDFNDLATQLGA